METSLCFTAPGTCQIYVNADSYGNTPLGQAMRVCDAHCEILMTAVSPPSAPSWPEAWQACRKVYAAWQDSETMRQRRAEEDRIERQRQEIIEFAKTLP